ncbi:MAG: CDP-alcohol phosphatidyltransferase family protein [Flavobacteriales bacterium]
MKLPRLPDLLTTANLSCGVASILFASQGQLTLACVLVFAGALFDVLDGLAARALGGGSELGKQLDSLADMVTFGVAPAFALYLVASEISGTAARWTAYPPLAAVHEPIRFDNWPVFFGAMGLVVASCWRLARFNVDSRQSSGFLGLPTPANALFWSSLCLVAGPDWRFFDTPAKLLSMILAGPYLTMIVALLMSALMLSSIPLPSLKFKHAKWKGNEVIYLLIGMGAVLIALYGVLAVPLILVVYLLSPLWGKLFKQVSSPKSKG